jgi:non-heme chloroperoxidase
MKDPTMRFAHVRLADGPRLYYAESGQRDGQPILFLHGWPDSWFSFSRVVPLIGSHWRALMPDQRGFGESEKPDGDYSIEQYARDAGRFLDALSIERATVVGHSFGSFVARRLALAEPARVERLILIGTGVSARTPVVLDAQRMVETLEEPVPEEFARSFQAGTAHVPLPEPFFDRIVTESLKLPAALWRQALNAVTAYDDIDELHGVAAPTLLMWGVHDALFSREDQDRVLSTIPGAAITIYEATGHCPNWERPEMVAADLTVFCS